jgi:hypothetical protein
MINEIPKHEWKQFFDDIGKKRIEWQTRVEVLKDGIGAQVLSDGLPLTGFVEYDKSKISAIQIIFGEKFGVPQTRTIFNPENIFFETIEDKQGGIIEINDKGGSKTMIYLTHLIKSLADYTKPKILSTV